MAHPENFQVFQPLDFIAEITQHIPNKGEHLIRYYGHYSHKTRGIRAKHAGSDPDQVGHTTPEQVQPTIAPPARLDRRHWAMLIKRAY